MGTARPFFVGAAASVVAHAVAALILARLPSPAAARAEARDRPAYEVDVSAVAEAEGTMGASERGRRPTLADPTVAGGPRAAQNLDARDRGQGGDGAGPEQVILMLDRAHDVLLFDSPLNNLAAAQTQRIRTARSRASLEHRRATPNPDDDPFLASGAGDHRERRPVRATDAAEGARVAPTASVIGGAPSIARTGEVAARDPGAAGLGGDATRAGGGAPASGETAGTRQPSPGRGILGGRGARRSEAARVAHGRPRVDQGPAATEAARQDARIRDNSDAENLAASMMHGWVASSAHSGPRAGPGSGGVGGGGAPGVGGGTTEGGRASTHGPGRGRHAALDTSDARYRTWFLHSRRAVQDRVVYPRARALAMDQGTAIFHVVVRRDGSLAGSPRLVRSSGFRDLDEAAREAIQAATPFRAIPRDLAPELTELSLRLPVEFSNPMVR